MKNFKHLTEKSISAILAVILMVSIFPVASIALTTDDGFTYKQVGSEISITRYDGDAVELIVPDTISGYPVTEICGGAIMAKKTIRKLALPKTIKRLGMFAIASCENMTEVNIEELKDLKEIGAMALFGNSKLTGRLDVPDSVTDIGAAAFSATGYSEIHLGSKVKPACAQKELIQNKMFDYTIAGMKMEVTAYSEPNQRNIATCCNNLTQITVDFANPYFTSIGGVLYNKGVTEIYSYPSGKTSKMFIVPKSVNNIYDAFSGNFPLKMKTQFPSIGGDPQDILDDWRYDNTNGNLETVILPEATSKLDEYAFYNSSIKSIFIPASITSIGKRSFWHCLNLQTVGFDRNSKYKSLPEQCFKDCPKLESVKFGKIEYLAELVFSNCTSIKNIDLTNVLGLSATAFDGCTSLQTVTYKDSDDAQKATVSASAFDNTASLKTVMLGSSVGKVEANAFSNCVNLNTVYISQEITDIDDTAFENCENLTIVCDSEQSYAYQYAVKNNIAVTTMMLSPIANQTYTSEEIKPELTVRSGDKLLQNGVDYDLFFEDNIDAGTASVIVFGKGDYSIFACVGKFAIMQRDINDSVKVSAFKDVAMTGQAVEPEVTMAYQKYILQKDLDYTVDYDNNVDIGKGKIIINGTGNFCGTLTKEFNITENAEEDLSDIISGDCDGDGNITIIDYAMVKAAMFNMSMLSSAQIKASDVNCDGVVDAFDVAEMDLIINQVR